MNLSQIFNIARWVTGQSNSTYFTDTYLLQYFNIVRHRVENELASIDWWLFWLTQTQNLTAWVDTYTTLASSSTVSWFKTINSVKVNYTWQKLEVIQPWALDDISIEKYYVAKWGTIVLNTVPTLSVTWWLVIDWYADLIDITSLSETEANLTIPYQYHDVLALWIAPYIFLEIVQLDKYEEYNKIFKERLKEVVDNERVNLFNTSFDKPLPLTS